MGICMANKSSIEFGFPSTQNPTKRRLALGLELESFVLCRLHEIAFSNYSHFLNQSWNQQAEAQKHLAQVLETRIYTRLNAWCVGACCIFWGATNATQWSQVVFHNLEMFGVVFQNWFCHPTIYKIVSFIEVNGSWRLDGTEGMNDAMWPPRTVVTDLNCWKGIHSYSSPWLVVNLRAFPGNCFTVLEINISSQVECSLSLALYAQRHKLQRLSCDQTKNDAETMMTKCNPKLNIEAGKNGNQNQRATNVNNWLTWDILRW